LDPENGIEIFLLAAGLDASTKVGGDE